jgi:hypothetical protein
MVRVPTKVGVGEVPEVFINLTLERFEDAAGTVITGITSHSIKPPRIVNKAPDLPRLLRRGLPDDFAITVGDVTHTFPAVGARPKERMAVWYVFEGYRVGPRGNTEELTRRSAYQLQTLNAGVTAQRPRDITGDQWNNGSYVCMRLAGGYPAGRTNVFFRIPAAEDAGPRGNTYTAASLPVRLRAAPQGNAPKLAFRKGSLRMRAGFLIQEISLIGATEILVGDRRNSAAGNIAAQALLDTTPNSITHLEIWRAPGRRPMSKSVVVRVTAG